MVKSKDVPPSASTWWTSLENQGRKIDWWNYAPVETRPKTWLSLDIVDISWEDFSHQQPGWIEIDKWLATMSETSKLQQWLFWHNNICCLILPTLEFCQLMKHLYLIVTASKIDGASPKKATPTASGSRYIYIYRERINMWGEFVSSYHLYTFPFISYFQPQSPVSITSPFHQPLQWCARFEANSSDGPGNVELDWWQELGLAPG